MTLSEKAAYIKGLADGANIDFTADTGKVLKAVIDILEDIALSVEDLEDTSAALGDEIDDISADLTELESEIYGDEDDDEDDDDEDEELYEIVCPACGEKIFADGEKLEEGSTTCPACGEKLEFELPEECDGECDFSCGCGCDCENKDE